MFIPGGLITLFTAVLQSDYRRIEAAFHEAEQSASHSAIFAALLELERHNRLMREIVVPVLEEQQAFIAAKSFFATEAKEEVLAIVLRDFVIDESDRRQLLTRLWHIVRSHIDDEQHRALPLLSHSIANDDMRVLVERAREMRNDEWLDLDTGEKPGEVPTATGV